MGRTTRRGEVNYSIPAVAEHSRARPAVVVTAPTDGSSEVTVRYLDTQEVSKIPFVSSQPYAGLGWGIFVGIQKGSHCLVNYKARGEPYIAAWLPNRYYANSDSMKVIAKKAGFPYSGEIAQYPMYQVLEEGELFIKSFFGASLFFDKEGSVRFYDPTGGQVYLDNGSRLIHLQHINFEVETDAGLAGFGPAVRNHTVPVSNADKSISYVDKREYITQTIALNGLKDKQYIAAASQPSLANRVYNEFFTKLYEMADTLPGHVNPAETPFISVRLGTVVGDSDLSGETTLNGKLIGDINDTTGNPTAASTATSSTWLFAKWKSLTRYFAIVASKLGWVKVRLPSPSTGNALDLKVMSGSSAITTLLMKADGNNTWDADAIINLQSGANGAARKYDEVMSTMLTDKVFWIWLAGMVAVITGTPFAGLQAAMAAYITLNPVPTSLTGEITKASNKVKIGGASV